MGFKFCVWKVFEICWQILHFYGGVNGLTSFYKFSS